MLDFRTNKSTTHARYVMPTYKLEPSAIYAGGFSFGGDPVATFRKSLKARKLAGY